MLKQFPNDDNTIHPDSEPAQSMSAVLAWVANRELAAWHLDKQLAGLEICGAALFFQSKQMISYAGDIIEPVAEQLVELVMRYWDAGHPGEIARFITLEPGEVDYFLFALPFAPGIILAALFDPSCPLSHVRSQAKTMVQNLITITPETSAFREDTGVPAQDEDLWDEEDEDVDDEDEMDDEFLDINVTDLLIHMPPPDPEVEFSPEPQAQQDVDLPGEEAILNDPSDIPSFLVPPVAQGNDLSEPVWEEGQESSPPSSELAVDQQIPQDEDLIQELASADVMEEQIVADPQTPMPSADWLEEPEVSKVEVLPEAGEGALDDGERETSPGEFSLERDLVLPWEMEESGSFLEDGETQLTSEPGEALVPPAAAETSGERMEVPPLFGQSDSPLDFLVDDLEGIPLPDEETGWMAPFTEQDPDLNQTAGEKPFLDFTSDDGESVPAATAVDRQALAGADDMPDILTGVLNEERLNVLDGISAPPETAEVEPEEMVFPDSSDADWESGTTDRVVLGEEPDEAGASIEQPVSAKISSSQQQPPTPAEARGFPYELPDQIVSNTRPDQLNPVALAEEADSGQEDGSPHAYTCVLVPNLPENMLVGPLAKKLGEWLPQLSKSFGWQLEKITIRPSYLQWTVKVPQAISTGRLVHNIRVHTSQRVYDHFPELKRRSPEDFWSPNQLIISGEQSPTPEMLESFIQRSRQHRSS